MAATIALFAALAVAAVHLERGATVLTEGRARINDGDTITLGGERIRLRGIDAPEYGQVCHRGGKAYSCGRTARDHLDMLIGQREVTCEGSERDRYGRLLAVCRTATVDLNRRMVEEGWAVAYGDYRNAEAAARDAQRGLWAGEFERPRQWRQSHGGLAETEHGAVPAIFDWLRQRIGW